MKRYVILVACAAALAGAPLAGQSETQKPTQKPTIKRVPAERLASLEGKDIFKEYCAVCHGPGGKGDGPAAKALKKPPADLTTISKRHNGFPRKTVEEMILAENEALPAHGNREMPIWGPIFRKSGGRDVEALAAANLIKFLESIQEK